MFSVGDRVVLAIETEEDENEDLGTGSTGTVVHIIYDDARIGVEWDDFNNGHDCAGHCSSMDSGWYVDECALEFECEPISLDISEVI